MIRRSVSSWDSPGSAGPDAAAGPRQVRPQPGQARELVLELGELDLEAALVGLGVQREDVEDQPAAVDDLDVEQALEAFCWAGDSSSSATRTSKPVSLLRAEQLLGLALADVPVRVDVAAVLPFGAHDLRARGRREAGQLGQRFLGGPAVVRAGVDGDQEGLLDGRGEVDGLSGAHRVVRIPAGGVARSAGRRSRSRRSIARSTRDPRRRRLDLEPTARAGTRSAGVGRTGAFRWASTRDGRARGRARPSSTPKPPVADRA